MAKNAVAMGAGPMPRPGTRSGGTWVGPTRAWHPAPPAASTTPRRTPTTTCAAGCAFLLALSFECAEVEDFIPPILWQGSEACFTHVAEKVETLCAGMQRALLLPMPAEPERQQGHLRPALWQGQVLAALAQLSCSAGPSPGLLALLAPS